MREHGGHPQVRHWLNQVADEIGEEADDDTLVLTLQRWIDEDRKTTALKALEGMIWEAGYRDADFYRPHLSRCGAAPARLARSGIPLYVLLRPAPAQKLFFAHSACRRPHRLDLRLVRYPDRRQAREQQLSQDRRRIGLPAPQILFLSDVAEELDAAGRAGMHTALLDRLPDHPTRAAAWKWASTSAWKRSTRSFSAEPPRRCPSTAPAPAPAHPHASAAPPSVCCSRCCQPSR